MEGLSIRKLILLMVLFALIAVAPSPFKKIEPKTAALIIPTKTVPKPVQAPKTEIPAVTPVEPETPPVVSPVAPEQPAEAVPVATNYPSDHVEIMQQAGVDPGDYGAVDYIISHESGWCATKSEGEYGTCQPYHGHSDYNGYGLCQSTPPGKMAVAGADWEQNPVTQMKWCSSYAVSRYGSWWAAYAHWIVSHNW